MEKLQEPLDLQKRDKKHLWHPLTQHQTHPDALGMVSAKGAVLKDESGKEYIDGIASWYTSMYGHCNPFILERVKAQMDTLDHVIFSGFTHEPAVKLSEMLTSLLPDSHEKIFFSDNGSTSVEVAIKMAIQYHYNRGERRNTLVAFENGFHGDTFGAMSVSGLSVYNGPFEDFFLKVERIPLPTGENTDEVISALKNILEHHDVAAFVYEPLVQGAAGMKMYPAEALEMLLQLCNQYGVVNIADEVMTGFGKTGTCFAGEQLSTTPDIICMSKALTAGLMPMGATSCTLDIYEAFLSADLSRGFFHGHTYTANPLACTAAIAGIELWNSPNIQADLKRIKSAHREFDRKISKHPLVKNSRQLGVIYALDLDVEMERYGGLRDSLYRHYMEHGAFLRPLGNTVYILPPYVTKDKELEILYSAIEGSLSLVERM